MFPGLFQIHSQRNSRVSAAAQPPTKADDLRLLKYLIAALNRVPTCASVSTFLKPRYY